MGIKDKAEGIKGASGESGAKGATKSDTSGERKAALKGGVGLGVKDKLGGHMGVGRDGFGGAEGGEFNSGRTEGVCYDHKRLDHDQAY